MKESGPRRLTVCGEISESICRLCGDCAIKALVNTRPGNLDRKLSPSEVVRLGRLAEALQLSTRPSDTKNDLRFRTLYATLAGEHDIARTAMESGVRQAVEICAYRLTHLGDDNQAS